jgi:hypothetical protein
VQRQAKPSQSEQSQANTSKAKQSQAKPSKVKQIQAKPSFNLISIQFKFHYGYFLLVLLGCIGNPVIYTHKQHVNMGLSHGEKTFAARTHEYSRI